MDNFDNFYDREFLMVDNSDYMDDIQKEKVKGGMFNEINEFRRNANEYVD